MQSYAKAIAGLITSGLLTLLVPFGITGDTTISDAIQAVIVAALTFLSVYVTTNRN
jgi:hypothetical protein